MWVNLCRGYAVGASPGALLLPHEMGHLAALVRSRRIGWQNNRPNKANNNPDAENNRAATHRKPIRKEASESCYPACRTKWGQHLCLQPNFLSTLHKRYWPSDQQIPIFIYTLSLFKTLPRRSHSLASMDLIRFHMGSFIILHHFILQDGRRLEVGGLLSEVSRSRLQENWFSFTKYECQAPARVIENTVLGIIICMGEGQWPIVVKEDGILLGQKCIVTSTVALRILVLDWKLKRTS